jgi:Bacterial dnaA protein helix-turn-helix
MHLASCGARDLRGAADVIAEARTVRARLLDGQAAAVAPAPAPTPAPPPAGAPELHWRPPSGAQIREIVARHYGLTRAEVQGESRRAEYVLPRHVAMYLCVRLGGLSLTLTGRVLNRDHTTVLHGVKRVARLSAENAALAAEIKTLWERCEAA